MKRSNYEQLSTYRPTYRPLSLSLSLSLSLERDVAHGAMGRRIDPSWGGPIEIFLLPASAPRLV